jgi:hypothetical protein
MLVAEGTAAAILGARSVALVGHTTVFGLFHYSS